MENDPLLLSSRLSQILAAVLNPFGKAIFSKAGQWIKEKWWRENGLYEVLEFESTLELQDVKGEHALVRKREKVRYLQNNIIAFQDQAWGDGKIMIDYKCAPGVPVDIYRPGQKTHILISLREVKHRDDVDEFNISWKIRKGFTRATEVWGTEISHKTRKLKVQIIFPKERPPLRVLLMGESTQKTTPLDTDTRVQLPDKRWMVVWETENPILNEGYVLKWDW